MMVAPGADGDFVIMAATMEKVLSERTRHRRFLTPVVAFMSRATLTCAFTISPAKGCPISQKWKSRVSA
jgi:hypothetical protein